MEQRTVSLRASVSSPKEAVQYGLRCRSIHHPNFRSLHSSSGLPSARLGLLRGLAGEEACASFFKRPGSGIAPLLRNEARLARMSSSYTPFFRLQVPCGILTAS